MEASFMQLRRLFPLAVLCTAGLLLPLESFAADGPAPTKATAEAGKTFEYFSFLKDTHYDNVERIALWVVLAIAVVASSSRGGPSTAPRSTAANSWKLCDRPILLVNGCACT